MKSLIWNLKALSVRRLIMYTIDLLNRLNTEQNNSLWSYKDQQFEAFKHKSYPKWKRLSYSLQGFPAYKAYNGLAIMHQDESIKIQPINELIDERYLKYLSIKRSYGVEKKLVTLSEVFCNAGVLVHIPQNKKTKPIHIHYKMDQDNTLLLDHNIIVAEPNSETVIVMEYDGVEGIEHFHSGVTKIIAGENAIVKLVKLQTLGDKATHFDSQVAVVKRDGQVHVIHADMGAKVIGSDYASFLEGNNSQAAVQGLYIGHREDKLDLSYKAYHEGEHSQSDMETRGVLKDKAKKVYRGTLDFKKGARLSKGREKESVILLNDTVTSHAIPALLCGEDDVEGEHAVSAGQINQEQLFYLMSRGLTHKEAKRVIVEANFEPVINTIQHDGIKAKIKEQVHQKLII